MTGDGILEEQADSGQPGARRRGRLHTQATQQLRSMILSGELPPGARLREVQLCEQLGVSRTPIREAFRTLAAEGMVDLLPNRSVVVAQLRSPDIAHLFAVVGALEALAGELAAQLVTQEQLAEIAGFHNEMLTSYERRDRGPYLELNHKIHRRVVEISGNPVLISTWQSLIPRVERARAIANLNPDRWVAAVYEHSRMLSALASHDGELLARLTREHFMNGLRHIPHGSEPGVSDV